MHLPKTRRIPKLRREVAAFLDLLFFETNIRPVGAIRIKPKRKPSAPYFSIKSSGSGELPNDLLIFRPL